MDQFTTTKKTIAHTLPVTMCGVVVSRLTGDAFHNGYIYIPCVHSCVRKIKRDGTVVNDYCVTVFICCPCAESIENMYETKVKKEINVFNILL